MSFWYNEPKDGAKYAPVGNTKWEEANSRIEFDEFAFCGDDDFYYVYAYATKCVVCYS